MLREKEINGKMRSIRFDSKNTWIELQSYYYWVYNVENGRLEESATLTGHYILIDKININGFRTVFCPDEKEFYIIKYDDSLWTEKFGVITEID